MTSPNGGERFEFGNTFDVSWTASDADSDPLAYRVELSRDEYLRLVERCVGESIPF